MINPKENTDQTLFIENELINQPDQYGEVEVKSRIKKELTPEQKKKKMMIIGIAISAFLLTLGLSLLLIFKPKPEEITNQFPDLNRNLSTPSEFQDQLDELSQELEAADPSSYELSLPAVDLEADLFEAKN